MKKLLVAGFAAAIFCGASALASDMPVKAPIYKAAEPLFDWNGLYVGVYAGIGTQQSRGFDPTGAREGSAGRLEYTGSGFTGGGTAGYNWQFNRNWLVGIEGDIGYLGLSHNVSDYFAIISYNSRTSWLGTLRGRVGYVNGPTLSYITGGGAWLNFTDSLVSTFGAGSQASSAKTNGGYAFGSGVETMLGGNWTAKAEYLHIDVGSGNTLTGTGGFVLQTDKHRYEVMRFGLNYLFGGKGQPPLPAHHWTGFYAGIIGGTAVMQARGSEPMPFFGGQIGNNGDGLTVGGVAGYNWQFAPSLVAGVEGDFSYLGINHTNLNYTDPIVMLGVKTSSLATLRGRVGYSTGPALLYVTGGGAWIKVRDSWQADNSGGGPLVTASKVLSGFTVGGGIETALQGNWTSKTEYLYVDGGKGDILVSAGVPMQIDHIFHVFRSALIYKFGSQ